jgi:hypothetical protein
MSAQLWHDAIAPCSADELLRFARADEVTYLYRQWVGEAPPRGGRAAAEGRLREALESPDARRAAQLRMSRSEARWMQIASACGARVVPAIVDSLAELIKRDSLPRDNTAAILRRTGWLRDVGNVSYGSELGRTLQFNFREAVPLDGPALPVFCEVIDESVSVLREAAHPAAAMIRALRLYHEIARSGGWKLTREGQPYARDADAALALWGDSDAPLGMHRSILPGHRGGITQGINVLLTAGLLSFDDTTRLLQPIPNAIDDPHVVARLLVGPRLSLSINMPGSWYSLSSTAVLNLVAASTWHARPGDWVEYLPLVRTLAELDEYFQSYHRRNTDRPPLTVDLVDALLCEDDDIPAEAAEWGSFVRNADRVLGDHIAGLGLACIGETSDGSWCIRPTELAWLVSGRAQEPAVTAAPRAWRSNSDDVVLDLNTLDARDVAALVSVSHSISIVDHLATLTIHEASLREALRIGIDIESVEEILVRLTGSVPSWWRMADATHARQLQKFSVLTSAKITPGKTSTSGKSEPAVSKGPAPSPMTVGQFANLFVARRLPDGRLNRQPLTGANAVALARLRRLSEERGGEWFLTRTSVQAAMASGITTDSAKRWLSDHLHPDNFPDAHQQLLTNRQAMQTTEGLLVRLPADIVGWQLPVALRAFQNCFLKNDIPWLLIPAARVEEWRAAVMAAGLD